MIRSAMGAACGLALSILVQGCVGVPYQTYDLVDDIAEDQQSLNDAYGRALNGQILLNVLRARDRWPRHYTNVSPMSDQPTVQTSGSVELSPLGLGSAASPFGGSNATLSHEESTRPSYGVQPLDSEAINRTVLSQTKRPVFAHYWSSGWPRDILLLVMVSEISRSEVANPEATEVALLAEGGRRRLNWQPTIYNVPSALLTCGNQFAADAPENAATWPADPASGATPDCRFYQLAHRLANFASGANRDRIRLRRVNDPDCVVSSVVPLRENRADLIASMASLAEVQGNRLSVRLHDPDPARSQARRQQGLPAEARGNVELANCPAEDAAPVLLEVLGPEPPAPAANAPRRGPPPERPVIATYYLKLRSLDDMVYAMGEQLRGDSVQPDPRSQRPRIVRTNGNLQLVHGSCSTPSCGISSMFRVYEQSAVERDEDYSAVVVHRGVRYFAGPATGERRIGRAGQVLDPEYDRTATVLTLLTQVFALNNSPGALAPIPARPVLD